ncbi:hypothetical protein QBC35DRAFT_183692 [Podospora australis]|uniref:Uncharacterized protein n=1 Tax=Podospora australis TaxID=1536484 RepID=A0AAN6WWJ2_9PEZI|nr:hypothetical protein QBC35DRAFT_183692 [Podospora australis]
MKNEYQPPDLIYGLKNSTRIEQVGGTGREFQTNPPHSHSGRDVSSLRPFLWSHRSRYIVAAIIPLEPPVTKTTLSELDVTKIMYIPKLRHDINFDPELHFRPNIDGKRKLWRPNNSLNTLLQYHGELDEEKLHKMNELVYILRGVSSASRRPEDDSITNAGTRYGTNHHCDAQGSPHSSLHSGRESEFTVPPRSKPVDRPQLAAGIKLVEEITANIHHCLTRNGSDGWDSRVRALIRRISSAFPTSLFLLASSVFQGVEGAPISQDVADGMEQQAKSSPDSASSISDLPSWAPPSAMLLMSIAYLIWLNHKDLPEIPLGITALGSTWKAALLHEDANVSMLGKYTALALALKFNLVHANKQASRVAGLGYSHEAFVVTVLLSCVAVMTLTGSSFTSTTFLLVMSFSLVFARLLFEGLRLLKNALGFSRENPQEPAQPPST